MLYQNGCNLKNSLNLQRNILTSYPQTHIYRKNPDLGNRIYKYSLHNMQYSYMKDNVRMIWLFHNKIQSMPDDIFYIALFNKEAPFHANQ
jgi:hypothetical protein